MGQSTITWKFTGRLPGKATSPRASTILNRTKQKAGPDGAVTSTSTSMIRPGEVSAMATSVIVWHWFRVCGASMRRSV